LCQQVQNRMTVEREKRMRSKGFLKGSCRVFQVGCARCGVKVPASAGAFLPTAADQSRANWAYDGKMRSMSITITILLSTMRGAVLHTPVISVRQSKIPNHSLPPPPSPPTGVKIYIFHIHPSA